MSGAKAVLRAELVAARAAMGADERLTCGPALARWLPASPVALGAGVTVACYVSVGTEPVTDHLLDALLATGTTVLLPVTPPGPPTTLDWSRHTGPDDLERGRFGLLEPTGPRLGPSAVAAASLVFVPALAVDRAGTRLGRGAGYYDRSIGGLDAATVAVVYDHEFLDAVPGDAHDVAMTWALTPGDGFIPLG